MEIKEKLQLIATQAANALTDEWDIGEFSNVKDEPVKKEEIIELLIPFLQLAYSLNY